jgi:hypothetical protein
MSAGSSTAAEFVFASAASETLRGAVLKWWFLPTFSELQAHTDEELRQRYDDATQAGQPMQATFALDELGRRESKRSEATMRRLTWTIAAPTLVNVAAVLVALFN